MGCRNIAQAKAIEAKNKKRLFPQKGVFEDLTNRKFGRLTVVSFSHEGNRRRKYWNCVCDCGNTRAVESSHLRSGHTSSCGCVNKNRFAELNKKTGLSNTKLYFTYRNMCNRCNRKTNNMYYIYGGRGISVCNEWSDKEHGFENFSEWALKNGYSENLSIDRIDNDKGYSPDNCRWVDVLTQANNRRNNHYIKINGEIDTVGNMARKYGVSYWNLLNYSKGGKNTMYPDLRIEVAN